MAAAERVLTQPELNRALLARQLLLERGRGPLPRTLERIGGIQAQYAPSMYVGLWSRMEGFERDDLTRALERRSVVQGTLMRVTIHLVSAADWWPLTVAVRDVRRDLWNRAAHRAEGLDRLPAAARALRKAMRGGSMTRKEIAGFLAGRGLTESYHLGGVGMWLDMVRVPPSGTWERRRADVYAAAEEWLGPPEIGRHDALDHLVRRYLGGFGPASAAEIADWAGLKVNHVKPALERLRLRSFRAEDGAELLDLPRAPLPDPETPAPVRFLPTWDATLLAHARRALAIAEKDRPRVFNTKTPQSAATFLVGGRVAGTWRHNGDRIVVEPFGRLAGAVRREVDEEAERLAAFHA